ncbi:MAG: SusD/RagB family nutrient-binding outer membrane lipoprotein, partial [Saprospiraceae bacterium]|nr:SusD/RagB family nutrient-binding outer membrane lipoprotein [Saprospiraceae bacterium]
SLGLASFYDFSQVDRTRMAKQTSPTLLVTAAQTHLLLAEAAHRGWISVPAKEFYDHAVQRQMEEMAAYGENTIIPEDQIAAYLSANPFDPNKALEQINTQYWIASFLKGPEAFSNFRRSGFPALSPNPFSGQDISGDFIRRLTYPNSEISVNSANVQEAISRQGPDNLDTRVWWDK